MINDIISLLQNAGGLSRPNKFSVQIVPPKIFNSLVTSKISFDDPADVSPTSTETNSRPDYFNIMGIDNSEMQSRLDIMCHKAELPGRAFTTEDVRTYGSYFKIPLLDTYSDLPLSFIVGKDMKEKDFMDAWFYTIQDPETSDFNYVDEYSTTIEVYQMDEYDEITYGVRFYQCWPVSIGQLTLVYDERNTYHSLPVTFTYRKWINIKINSTSRKEIKARNKNTTAFENTIIRNK